MKKRTAVLIAGCAGMAATAANRLIIQKKESSLPPLPENFTVTAHTGCDGTEDNTVESIFAGAVRGADIVEIDLNYLSDGTPVLSHDSPSQNSVPTLESAFEALASLDIRMNVDVKSTANLAEVCRLAEKHGVTEKIFFTGVEIKDVDAVRKDAPGIPYYLNTKVDKSKNTDAEYLACLADTVSGCGAIGINMNFRNASEKLVDTLRSRGLLVSLWTAKNKKTILRCLALAPDNVTTRKVAALKKTISK